MGNVAWISEIHYHVSEKFGEINKSNFIYDDKRSHIKFYNKNGFIIKNTSIDKNGLDSYVIMKEYENDQLKVITQYSIKNNAGAHVQSQTQISSLT